MQQVIADRVPGRMDLVSRIYQEKARVPLPSGMGMNGLPLALLEHV
jgi:hypothetical protein